MIEITRDIENLWLFLSDAWANLDDKSIVESLWQTTASGVDMLMNKTMEIQNSRSLEYLPAVIDDAPMTYTFVYSGIESLENVLETSLGKFKYYIDDWTLSIPTLEQEYTYLNSGVIHTYYEGTDYTISGMNTLIWLTQPLWDERYTTIETFTVSAPIVYRINPILMNAWARFLNIDIDKYNSYNTYNAVTLSAKYKHLKYFIWALVTKQLEHPTIATIQNALSIAHGLPFAYNAGIITYTHNGNTYTVTVGEDVYYLPSGLVPIASGTVVEKFDPLVSGIYVWDYYNNPTIVNLNSNMLTKYNTVIVQNTISGLEYNAEFYEDYRDKLLPIQLHKVFIG
jgi:hypothetical protein